MVARIINATEVKTGTNILLEREPFTVKKVDISSTGKHGHSKCRIEATGIINSGKKKVFVIPGHDRLEIPVINKNKAQVLSFGAENKISIMDLETFETIELDCPEEIKKELEENSNVEYWDVEGQKIVKRRL